MPEAFKNNFNVPLIRHLGAQLKQNYDAFDEQIFIQKASHQLETLELKARSNQICDALMQCLPADFSVASQVILSSLAPPSLDETIQFDHTNKGPENTNASGIAGWIIMPVSDYVTQAALLNIEDAQAPNFKMGLDLLKECTKRFSAEFAIRPFLRDFPIQTLQVLKQWAQDDNVHVRRLASEGSRPLLPWGIRLHTFVESPESIVPILEQLRDDESEYVRRSVANSLNDIAKHHPDKVAKIAADWWQQNNRTRAKLIKHACRTLLKNGHAGALSLFGYPPATLANVTLTLGANSIAVGDSFSLSLSLSNLENQAQSLFKWTSINVLTGEHKTLSKQHSFKPVTTRKYYAGAHKIAILINGEVFCEQDFLLVGMQPIQ
jgi:3-methyladenine DNA glycosylase AlkC